MAHKDFAGPDERFTPEKAEAFVARYRDAWDAERAVRS